MVPIYPCGAYVRRIHIVGGGGSGKSTLARTLAARFRVPAFDLDMVAYEGGAGPRRSLEARLADVRRIAAQAGWVTEGIYLWWVDELVETADLIIWLDVPWRVAAWRIITRHVRLTLAGTNRFPGWWRLARFVWWTRGYYRRCETNVPADLTDVRAITRAATIRYLAPRMVLVPRSPADNRLWPGGLKRRIDRTG